MEQAIRMWRDMDGDESASCRRVGQEQNIHWNNSVDPVPIVYPALTDT